MDSLGESVESGDASGASSGRRDGSELFIVDNSVSGWTGLEYLRQWCDISRSFDIATGFFEIGSLLELDGHWQQPGFGVDPDGEDEADSEDVVPPELADAADLLDRSDYDVSAILTEVRRDLDRIAGFLSRTKQFRPSDDDKLHRLIDLLAGGEMRGRAEPAPRETAQGNLLRRTFGELWIIDLGGEGRGALTEENVFDIQTPVAVAVRTGTERTGDCVARYQRVEGDRSDKLARLRSLKLRPDQPASAGSSQRSSSFEQVPGTGLERFVPISSHDHYDWPQVTDLFPWIRSVCKLGRTWPIAESKAVLERRWRDFTSRIPRQRADALIEPDRTCGVSAGGIRCS